MCQWWGIANHRQPSLYLSHQFPNLPVVTEFNCFLTHWIAFLVIIVTLLVKEVELEVRIWPQKALLIPFGSGIKHASQRFSPNHLELTKNNETNSQNAWKSSGQRLPLKIWPFSCIYFKCLEELSLFFFLVHLSLINKLVLYLTDCCNVFFLVPQLLTEHWVPR